MLFYLWLGEIKFRKIFFIDHKSEDETDSKLTCIDVII